jgi:carbonic anhydrase
MERYRQIFENNKKWVESKLIHDPDYFLRLSAGQSPDFLYIGCADSRVPANEIMGLEPGEVFVHRNVANLVVNTDLNVHSVIEYAVEHLKVKHVIVCGHYGCGGVNAAMSSRDLGLLNPWLREIRDVFRLHKKELIAIDDEQERAKRLVELNVQEGYPKVHGWVFDLHDGLLKDLHIPFEQILEGIREIYRLEV